MTESQTHLSPNEQNSELLLDALSRVLDSKVFAEVFRLKKFLDYSVRETLAGRGERLKGFVNACEVFGKEDPSDAQTTTVVRVEAGRLRRRLDDYYRGEGKNDPFRISIPKGGYSASFAPVGIIPAKGPASSSANTREITESAIGQISGQEVKPKKIRITRPRYCSREISPSGACRLKSPP